jgi:hypothetical protein
MGAPLFRELHPADLLRRPSLSHHGRFRPAMAPTSPRAPPSLRARPATPRNPRFAGNAPLGRPPPETREISLFPHISA